MLVVVQLRGGNDGLNTLVPWSSSVYHAKRPSIRVDEREVLRLNDAVGLNPTLEGLHELYQRGALAIVRGRSSR